MTIRLISVAALAMAVVTAHAGTIYGLNDLRSQFGGGIYSIDTSTGATSLVAQTGVHGIQGNGLAFDMVSSFYFAVGNQLYKSGLGGGSASLFSVGIFSGTLATSVTNAAFYNNSYYYADGDVIRSLNLATGVTSTLNPSPIGNLGGFGDIAIDNGILYASSSVGFFSVNLSTGASNVIGGPTNPTLQLGFQGSTLYGITADTDNIYSINQGTGARTFLSTLGNTNLRMVDAASSPVPEPFTMALGVMGLAAYARKRRLAKKG